MRNCLLQRIDQNLSSSEDRLFWAEDQDQSMQEHFLSSLSLLPIGGARQPSWLLLADVPALRPTLDTSTASFHLFSSSSQFSSSFDHLHTECIIICFYFSPSLVSILLQKQFSGKFKRYWLHLVSAEKTNGIYLQKISSQECDEQWGFGLFQCEGFVTYLGEMQFNQEYQRRPFPAFVLLLIPIFLCTLGMALKWVKNSQVPQLVHCYTLSLCQ